MLTVKRLRNIPFRWLPGRAMSSCDPVKLLMDPKGKVACVTGAGDGIGFEICKHLLQAGCKICASDANYKAGTKRIRELQQSIKDGGEIFFTKCDVRKQREFECMFLETAERYGCPDIMVNNAGILNDHQYFETVDINAQGTVRGTFLAMDLMSKKNGGKGGIIVNNSSICGFQIFRGAPVYVGTKHFQVGFSRSIGDEWHYKQTGVRVCVMCPGFTDTILATGSHSHKIYSQLGENEDEDDECAGLPFQSVESTARCLMHIIRFAPSGSCWVCEAGEFYKVIIPDRRTYRDSK